MIQAQVLNVDKWQAARPRWQYRPVLWFSYRMIHAAWLDALSRDGEGRITDEALLARDWFARSGHAHDARKGFVSFAECCERLGLNDEVERLDLLARIDASGDFDTEECDARLEALSRTPIKGDVVEKFRSMRVVPVLDQGRLDLPAQQPMQPITPAIDYAYRPTGGTVFEGLSATEQVSFF